MNIQINSNNNKIVSGEGEIDYTTSCLFHLLHNTGGVGGGVEGGCLRTGKIYLFFVHGYKPDRAYSNTILKIVFLLYT